MGKVLIIGASGLVGKELEKLLIQTYLVEKIGRNDKPNFSKEDIAIFCTPDTISKKLIPVALEKGCRCIDLSSAYRSDPSVPLVIPEINGDLLAGNPPLVASPNCTASIMAMVLAPLHKAFSIRRIQACTYQAASGAGYQGLAELLEGKAPEVFPCMIKHNLFLHEKSIEEEAKIAAEITKLLRDETILINSRTVRVPVVRAHSIAMNVSFHRSPEGAFEILSQSPGIEYHESPTPQIATGNHNIYFGPIRKDCTLENSLDLWVVGDQLLKGAALNAFQILKGVLRKSLLCKR